MSSSSNWRNNNDHSKGRGVYYSSSGLNNSKERSQDDKLLVEEMRNRERKPLAKITDNYALISRQIGIDDSISPENEQVFPFLFFFFWSLLRNAI